MRYSALHFYVVTMAVAFLSLAGCSKGGGPGPDPGPSKYTILVKIQDDSGSAIAADKITFGGDVIGTNTASASATREENTSGHFSAVKSGFTTGESATITFSQASDGTTVPITLTKDTPDSVAISYDIRDAQADSLVKAEADLTVDGSPVSGTAGKAKGTLTLPYGDSAVTICATADYFKDSGNCTSVTPDADKPAHLTLSRKQVTVAVTVTDQSGGSIDDPSIQVDGYTYESGEESHDFGARSGKRKVSVAADGYKKTAKQVSADQSQDVSLSLPRVYACNDGKDNDGDGRKDANDSGCVDSQASTSHIPGSDGFVYQPDDDSEVLKGLQRSIGITSRDRLVSSKKGQRQYGLFSTVFPRSIQFAVGSIDILIKNKIETAQTGEAFALDIRCGPSRNNHPETLITDIVPDDQSIDGFRRSPVHGFTRAILQNGTDCSFYAIHASKVRGDSPGDGKDDVYFSTEDADGGISITWYYEEEEVK